MKRVDSSRFWTEQAILLLRKYAGPLEAPQAATLAKLALENAEGLLADAEFLINGGRYARAIFLAIAAIEEIGKVPLVISGYLRRRTKKQWNQFWTRFRRHSTKLLMATLGELTVLDEDAGDKNLRTLLDVVPRRQMWRELCLYVDCYDGQVVTPASFADVDELRRIANDLVRQAKFSIGLLGFIPHYFSADRLAAVLEQHRNAVDWNDPKESMQFLLELAKKHGFKNPGSEL